MACLLDRLALCRMWDPLDSSAFASSVGIRKSTAIHSAVFAVTVALPAVSYPRQSRIRRSQSGRNQVLPSLHMQDAGVSAGNTDAEAEAEAAAAAAKKKKVTTIIITVVIITAASRTRMELGHFGRIRGLSDRQSADLTLIRGV